MGGREGGCGVGGRVWGWVGGCGGGLEGVGWVGGWRAMKWQAKFKSTVKTAKCHPHLQISHEAAKSIAKLISQLLGKLQPADCLSRADGAI